MYALQNAALRLEVSARGAEIQSLVDLTDGREIIWHGDATYWNGRSPILFPITGGLWNGTCRLDGRSYQIPKHGFVRRRDWQFVEQGEDFIRFAIENTDEELKQFPWPYRLEVTYTLRERTLRTDLRVTNRSHHSSMWFQVGAHPALNLRDWTPNGQRVAGFLRFEGAPRDLLRAGSQGCIEPARVPIPWSKNLQTLAALAFHQMGNALVPIGVDTFANEALIFDARQVEAVEVLDRKRRRYARVASSAPVWLIWQPVGKHAPFVCVEPWYGLPDTVDFDGEMPQRPEIQRAAPQETWEGWWTLEV